MKFLKASLLLMMVSQVSLASSVEGNLLKKFEEKLNEIGMHAEHIGSIAYKLKCRSSDIEDRAVKQKIRKDAAAILQEPKFKFISTHIMSVYSLGSAYSDCGVQQGKGEKCVKALAEADDYLTKLKTMDQKISRLNDQISEETEKQEEADDE